MRVFILTLPFHTNIGGVLQCYALQTVLKHKNYDVYVIHRNLYGHSIKASLLHLRDAVFDLLFVRCNLKINFIFRKFFGEEICNAILLRKFVRSHLNEYSINNLYNFNWEKGDIVIVGSDQVWRKGFINPLMNAYCDFLKDDKIKRIAYGVSFGKKEVDYNENELSEAERLLRKFSNVSVRENDAAMFCKKVFNINADVVLDPTLLLSRNDYLKLCQSPTSPKRGGYSYILDDSPEIRAIIDNVSNELDIPFTQYENIADKDNSIEKFLSSYAVSLYIVTDSFHGTVFSIIFHKNFITINNPERGSSRFYTLLESVGLSDRLIDVKTGNSKILDVLQTEIDWADVDKRIEELRSFSLKNLTLV